MKNKAFLAKMATGFALEPRLQFLNRFICVNFLFLRNSCSKATSRVLGIVLENTKEQKSGTFVRNARSLLCRSLAPAMLLACGLGVGACNNSDVLGTSQTYVEGYVVDSEALESVPVGSSRDQVLLALGSPSTTAIFDEEVFYYISQTRYRGAQFMKPKVVDRRVLAIYFDVDGLVAQIANYGLQDGKLFDFSTRTTPTGGKDQSFLSQLIMGTASLPNAPTAGR